MIRFSVLYPNTPNARFDMDYYIDKHMPLSIELLSAHGGYKGVTVVKGVGGAVPGVEPAFKAMCEFAFNSADDFMAAFVPHAQRIQGDMLNYTDIEPVIQVSEVMLQK